MDDQAQRSPAARDPLAGDCTVTCSTNLSSACFNAEDRKTVPVQVVHEFVGYTPVWWAQTLYSILVLLSLGLIWVLGFYTVHASLWTLQECPLADAEFVCVQVRLLNMHTGYPVPLLSVLATPSPHAHARLVDAITSNHFYCCPAADQWTPQACTGSQTASCTVHVQIIWGGQSVSALCCMQFWLSVHTMSGRMHGACG